MGGSKKKVPFESQINYPHYVTKLKMLSIIFFIKSKFDFLQNGIPSQKLKKTILCRFILKNCTEYLSKSRLRHGQNFIFFLPPRGFLIFNEILKNLKTKHQNTVKGGFHTNFF